MREHTYAGEYRSAIARAKTILLKAGFTWSTTTGRSHPFASDQKVTDGVKVVRVGVSDTVTLHVRMRHSNRAGLQATSKVALETLRAGGLPFDDRGFLVCRRES